MSVVSHSRNLLCHTTDMSAASHSRSVCCVRPQTWLLCHTADMSSVRHRTNPKKAITILRHSAKSQGHMGPPRTSFFRGAPNWAFWGPQIKMRASWTPILGQGGGERPPQRIEMPNSSGQNSENQIMFAVATTETIFQKCHY